MSRNPRWKDELQALIDRHNWRHGRREKNVSHKTREERARILFLAFRQLRSLGFGPAPANLTGAHIQVLVDYWTANPRLASRCDRHGVALPDRPLSPATLQARLSALRVFCGWIGKPGMVLGPEHYVAEPALVRRTYLAQQDRSWSAKGVDPFEMVARFGALDPFVAAQAEMILRFGLRKKESIMLKPYLAVVPASLVAALAPAQSASAEAYLACVDGTKGGRLRLVPIDSEAKRQAIESAQRLAAHPHFHLGRPGKSLKQNLNRFAYVMKKAGITRRQLEVTIHGLRHQFANDLYLELTQIDSPVRGGEITDRERHLAACLEIARQLGHGRIQVSGAYLGPILGALGPSGKKQGPA